MKSSLSHRLDAVRQCRYGPHAGLVLVALWLTRTFWLPGRYMVGFDTFAYSGPNSVVTAEAVRQWRIPLINEYIFGGVSHLGNPQAGVLYLPRLLTVIMDVNRAMGFLVVMHVILLGFGMRRFLRAFGCSEIASVFGAIVLMGSGAIMTKAVQFEQIIVVAWLPWLLTEVRSLLSLTPPRSVLPAADGRRRVVILGLIVAAVCSAGHPQMTYELALVAAIFALVLVIQEFAVVRSLRLSMVRTAHVMFAVVLGVLLVLPQLWASLVATSQSALGSGRNLENLSSADLVLPLRTVARALFGNLQHIQQDLFVGSFETITYVGVTIVVLAIVGFVAEIRAKRARSWTLGLVIAGFVAFVFSLGPKTVIFRAAFRFLPGFDLARVSARWLVVVTFVLSVGAAIAVDVLRTRVSPRVLKVSGALISAGFFGILLAARLPHWDVTIIWIVTASGVFMLVASLHRYRNQLLVVVLVILGSTEVLLNSMTSPPQSGRSDFSFSSIQSDLSDWLADSEGYTVALTKDFGPVDEVVLGQRPNANVLLGVRSIDGYDGGVQITKSWANSLRRFSEASNAELPLRNSLSLPLDSELAARTGIRFLLVERSRIDSSTAIGWGEPVRSEGLFDVYENPSWQGEARVWYSARSESESEIQEILRNSAIEMNATALSDSTLTLVPETCDGECSASRLISERQHPELIHIEAQVESPALVTFPVQNGSGWTATVDGERARMVPLDGLFLGVEIPAGDHVVEFEYRPSWLMPTVSLSLLSWSLVMGWLVFNAQRRRVERSR